MSERLLYEIQGTSALACSKSSDRVERIIDYDIARRSFESHMRFGINPNQLASAIQAQSETIRAKGDAS